MFIFRLSAMTLLAVSSLSLIGCSESAVKPSASVNQSIDLLSADIDLMIEKAKTAERARVQAEYAQQALTASVFANLRKMNLPVLAGSCVVSAMVPAQYLSSDTKLQISKERLSYRAVVCKEHFTLKNIIKLQASLREKGYLKSAEEDRASLLNGLWDERTQLAMLTYQKDNALAYGVERVEWTLESLRHLNLL